MSTQDIGLLQALTAKMSYLNQRQSILSQNIANANTPEYKPHDLKEVDFGAVLKDVLGEQGGAKLEPVTTDPKHMGGVNEIASPKNAIQKKTYETKPDGNAVVMEEQMVKSAQNTMDYNLMTTVYEKNIGMIRTAIDPGH
jgi:flagellar basal-body rod protein FlgB